MNLSNVATPVPVQCVKLISFSILDGAFFSIMGPVLVFSQDVFI